MRTEDGSVPAPIPKNEAERLLALRNSCVIDAPPDPVLDDLTTIGAALFATPIVFISLVDERRQVFLSATGMNLRETSRDSSFCAYTILHDGPFIVPDTWTDDRFRTNPLVTGPPYIRFYAAAPLIDGNGMRLGSFCVLDSKPREAFASSQVDLLSQFASLSVKLLERRGSALRAAEAETRLRQTNERFALATRATTDGIWDWDCTTDVVFFSARLRSMLGFDAEDHFGDTEEWLSRLHPDDARIARANIARLKSSDVPGFESQYRVRHLDGTWRWVHNRGLVIRENSGKLLRLTGAITDVTSRTTRDPVTGLASKAALSTALEARFTAQTSPGRTFALLFIDLDLFQRVNDSFGHEVGDQVLTELGRRMQQTVDSPADGTVARLGRDEFCILMADAAEEVDALSYAQCLQYLLGRPVQCGPGHLQLSASIGIAMGSDIYDRPERMMHDADLAMHQAKINGKAQVAVFRETLREHALQRMSLESELRDAVDRNELFLHYQPKVDLRTRAILGFEALLRWRHPLRGLVPPDEFIPLAEESDLIVEIGRFTLRESIRQLASWRSLGLVSPTATVAVNLSAKQFRDRGLVDCVERKLSLYKLPPECLSLEVTESTLIVDSVAALEVLQRLRAIGVGLDLDDFGTGYSSLSYLQRFPFHALKIDRTFIRRIEDDRDASAIAGSIVALGQALNLKTIAEGVETQQQAILLRGMGCDCAQGYLFAKPLPPESLVALLRANPQPYVNAFAHDMPPRPLPSFEGIDGLRRLDYLNYLDHLNRLYTSPM